MPFDPATARPIKRGGFDPSTARPIGQVAESQTKSSGLSLSNAARQISTGFAGGQTGGLTDILANRLGTPQSPLRDIAGVAGMFTPTPISIPFRAAKLAGTLTGGIPKAGVLGRMAVRVAEGAFGAGATQLGEAVEQRSASPILQAAGMGGVVGAAVPPIGAAIKSVPRKATELSSFLTGNESGILQAKRKLGESAQSLVHSLRPDGSLAPTFWNNLKVNSEKAWRPMREVIKAVKEPFTMDEVEALAQVKFANDPVKLQNVQELIKIASNQPKPPRLFDFRGDVIEFPKGSWTAQELDELSSGFGEGMRRIVKQGGQPRDAADQLLADTRSLIADLIEQKAPADMKGMVRQAKAQYSSYKTDVETAFRFFRPAAPKEAFTKSGVSAMKRVSAGQPGAEDETQFFERFKKNYGIDVIEMLKSSAKNVEIQEKVGAQGKAIPGGQMIGRGLEKVLDLFKVKR